MGTNSRLMFQTIGLAGFSTFLPALQSGVFFQLAKFQMAGLKTKLKCTGNALVSSNHTANVAGSKKVVVLSHDASRSRHIALTNFKLVSCDHWMTYLGGGFKYFLFSPLLGEGSGLVC